MKFLRQLTGLLLLATGSATVLRADPQSELAAFSAFPQVNLNDLSGGQVLQVKGSSMQFKRGMAVQSLTVLDAPVAKVQERMMNWDPTKYKELGSYWYQTLPAGPITPQSFASLSKLPNNRSTAYLIDGTTKLGSSSTDIQVSKSEARLWSTYAGKITDKASRKAAVLDYWKQVLSGRLNLFDSGKYKEEGSYESSSETINSFVEIQDLIRADKKVFGQFSNLLQQTPFFTTGTSRLPDQRYATCYDVQGQSTLATGAVYFSPNGSGIQVVDYEFYENYGLFCDVEIDQLWPVMVNGKEETLDWRQDMVSAPEIASLKGTDRIASSMIMLQDIKQSLNAFRNEFK